MSRYIEADKLTEAFVKAAKQVGNIGDQIAFRMMINKIPAADVVEVEKVNKIYEKLADLFDIPCNYSPCDEIMLESERCREDCGNISDAECWKRYFEVVCDGERADT